MNRREFLRYSLTAGAFVALPRSPLFTPSAWAEEKADLAVATGPSPEKITRAAVEALGGMKRFIGRGDVVVVKPNIGWDRTVEQAANTNPEVVAAIVSMCLETGAKTVRVFDRTCNDPRRCYVQSGIAERAKARGADVYQVDDRKFRNMSIGGEAIREWPIYTDIVEADKVINVPIAKHHGLARLTLGMKNWMGVMGGSRNKIHQKIDPSLVDLARFIKPTLTVLDAYRILVANGPQGGSLADVRKPDTVIAGTDPVAVDAYGATLFGLTGADLGYVRIGHETGLGTFELHRLSIRKMTVPA